MFENFKTIKIKGGCFEKETPLQLFKKDKLTVVYGRNGSGKTTIAKRISELVMPEEERNSEFEVSTDDIAIGPEQQNQVFIFDEDFVTEQVRFRKDGIDTIVMLGEGGELDKQIDDKEKVKKVVESKIEALKALKADYEDEGNEKSPNYHYNKLYNALRDSGGWADRHKEIRGISTRGKVSDDLIDDLLAMPEPTESYEDLYGKLRRRIDEFKQSKDADQIFWEGIALNYPEKIDTLEILLKKPVDKPELSEREQRLLAFIAQHPHSNREQMMDEGWEFCPLCLRDIKQADRTYITVTLTKLLNKEAEQFKIGLANEKKIFDALSIVMPEFPGELYQKELSDTRKDLERLAQYIQKIINIIDWRALHVYEVLENPFDEEFKTNYQKTLSRCKAKVNDIQKKVDSFNKMVNERKDQEANLIQENLVAARKKESLGLGLYKQAKDAKKKNEEELAAQEKEKEEIEANINDLTAQKERTDIALDYINDELNYVFYSNKKLQLVASENNKKYKLLVNDNPVSPDKISVGERNVLALCYFFATIYSNKEAGKRYNSEYLIVIDDPVSSFDYGNRLGVMTLLRYQFDCILNGNSNSRILVLSHDLYSVFDLVKVKNDVCGKSKDCKDEPKGYMTLENSQLKGATIKNEYGLLLNFVYDYAITKADGEEEEKEDSFDSGIGNIMRKLLEGFASFCYNKNFMDMLNMDSLFEGIELEKKRTYYSNFMFRLALNSESHLEEQTYSFHNMYKLFTREEKVKTAKSLLLFLLYVNKLHIEAYLVGTKKDEHDNVVPDRSKIEMIESWQKEEEEWIKKEGTLRN